MESAVVTAQGCFHSHPGVFCHQLTLLATLWSDISSQKLEIFCFYCSLSKDREVPSSLVVNLRNGYRWKF